MSRTCPARFMLAEAMNPCPCGFHNDRTRDCQCTSPMIQRYISKISGPLMRRIDILTLNDEEIHRYAHEMSDILTHIEKLNELSTPSSHSFKLRSSAARDPKRTLCTGTNRQILSTR